MDSVTKGVKSLSAALPVAEHREAFLEQYEKSPIIMLTGATGSGKTTQIPQYILEKFLQEDPTSKLKVACTQPRVVAATSVAKRVASERNVVLGAEVGYKVRFDNTTTDATRLIYMTDGILTLELVADPTLSRYKCIIIDEAHERTVNTDILMAKLKGIATKRSDLKVVIMSATLDADKFKKYFGICPVCKVEGRTFPVEIYHLEKELIDLKLAMLQLVQHIHRNKGPGDILVFVEGVEEIRWLCDKAAQLGEVGLITMPLHASLSQQQQAKVFAPAVEGTRKCVVATNVAETSITIDGIVYVIDSGLVKEAHWNARLRMNALPRTTISQASANQRAGRAGRTKPGTCYRMYTKEHFDQMPKLSAPQIQYTNFAPALLRLMASKDWKDLGSVDLISLPPLDYATQAMEDLHDLQFLTPKDQVTPNARSKKFNVPGSMITSAAIDSIEGSMFQSSDAHKHTLEHIHRQWACPLSDHVTQLNAFYAYLRAKKNDKNHLDIWCRDHMLSQENLEKIDKIRNQVAFKYVTGKKDPGWTKEPEWSEETTNNVRKALALGRFRTIATRLGRGETYKTVHHNQDVLPSPTSVVQYLEHNWVVYNRVDVRARPYMTTVTVIEPEWIMHHRYFQLDRMPLTYHDKTPIQKALHQKLEALRKA
ncbi:hypothetical protein NPX13_g7061 [Xylaria arbuscula]|uniref:Uncharacterized protein n=1 Tax=Xylaria arbuscula TaxID=114810 RepID=A0A9W8NB18_9PEZI|nr:hypothetical protein NPX13_g7061 [Xylaria arbuscula]